MKCTDVYLHICDNLDQDINSPRCRAIKKHIASCPDCMAYLESLKTTVTLYRALPAPRVPRTAHANLLRALRSIEKKKPR
jgi:anti-sigma factor RsiW